MLLHPAPDRKDHYTGEAIRIWRRLRRHRMAIAGMVGVSFILAFVIIGTLLIPERRSLFNDITNRMSPPTWEHPFGTDNTGRDTLARVVYGGQISLGIGLVSAALSMVLGLIIGAPSGFYGGWLDGILMRITEAMLVIPRLFLLILLARIFGDKVPPLELFGRTLSPSVVVVVGVIGVTSWMSPARVIRGSVLSLRTTEFITAARCMGATNRRIIFRHLVPNLIGPLTVSLTLAVAQSVLTEAYASFLGLGVQAPTPSWGNMLDRATQYLELAPWLWIFPGLMIILTVMSINFLGDGLRDALDPQSRTQRG
jgi:peptide/nickel transport system permease protein